MFYKSPLTFIAQITTNLDNKITETHHDGYLCNADFMALRN